MLRDQLTIHGADPQNVNPKVDSLPELVRLAAKTYQHKKAWHFELTGQTVSFSEIEWLVERVAKALADRGVVAESAVGLITENSLEFPISWLALSWLSVPMVPINNRYGLKDAAHLIEVAELRVVIAARKFLEFLETLIAAHKLNIKVIVAEDLLAEARQLNPIEPQKDPGAVANIQFTSGTTGKPKGCLLGHDYWLHIAHTLTSEFPNISSADIMLTAQGFYYIDPQWNLVTSLYTGATLVALDGFHPSTFWEDVRRFKVTYFYCLGMMPNLLLQMPASPDDKKHLVRAIQASAIPVSIHRDLVERWGVVWYEAFGMTETGADIFVGEADGPGLVGSSAMGRPRNHRSVKIVDNHNKTLGPNQIGNLMLTGPGMMRGYFKDPESTNSAISNGWFATGDLASFDERGLLFHRGRTKDMIRRSGENISSVEVETVLNTHDLVHLSGLIPVLDELKGEEPMALIETNGPIENEAQFFDDLGRYCLAQLAKFKVPRYWRIIPKMPLTVSERVPKAELKQAPYLHDVWDASTHQIVARVQV